MNRSRWFLIGIVLALSLAFLIGAVGASAGPNQTPCGGNSPQCYLVTITGANGTTFFVVEANVDITATFTNESRSASLGSVQWTLPAGATPNGACPSPQGQATISTSGNTYTVSNFNIPRGGTGSITCPVNMPSTPGDYTNTVVAQVNPNFTSGVSSNVMTQDPASVLTWTVGYGVECAPGQPCGKANVNSNTTSCSNQTNSGSARMRVCLPPNPGGGTYVYSFYDATNGGETAELCLTVDFTCVAVWNGGLLPPGFSASNPVSVTILVGNTAGLTPYKEDETGTAVALERCSQSEPPCYDKVPKGFEIRLESADIWLPLGH